MQPLVRKVVRQRMMLGAFLLVGALLFWLQPVRARFNDTPRFGYEVQDVAEMVADTMHRNGFDVPHYLAMQDSLFLPPANAAQVLVPARVPVTADYLAQLEDFTYVRTRIFLEDPSTMLLPGDIDVHEFINADLRIDASLPGPHVLIFHTHSTEWFVDTGREGALYDPMTGIMGVGHYLAQVLATYYGLEVLHHTGRFDVVEGRPHIRGAYERMEPVITQLLADHPQIQLVIDLHRDGVREGGGPFTQYLNGTPTARLMFFNGLSRRNVNGEPQPVAWLPNPHQRENLQFSFQAQLAANYLFPGFNRRIYLRAYRFSLHMHPRTLFVEVGNQYNTLQEAKNAMHPLAAIIAQVVLSE